MSESPVASRPTLKPPNQALNMTAQRNTDTGAVDRKTVFIPQSASRDATTDRTATVYPTSGPT
jgi:hypothetical protein